jgi:hypothetical protein
MPSPLDRPAPQVGWRGFSARKNRSRNVGCGSRFPWPRGRCAADAGKKDSHECPTARSRSSRQPAANRRAVVEHGQCAEGQRPRKAPPGVRSVPSCGQSRRPGPVKVLAASSVGGFLAVSRVGAGGFHARSGGARKALKGSSRGGSSKCTALGAAISLLVFVLARRLAVAPSGLWLVCIWKISRPLAGFTRRGCVAFRPRAR